MNFKIKKKKKTRKSQQIEFNFNLFPYSPLSVTPLAPNIKNMASIDKHLIETVGSN